MSCHRAEPLEVPPDWRPVNFEGTPAGAKSRAQFTTRAPVPVGENEGLPLLTTAGLREP